MIPDIKYSLPIVFLAWCIFAWIAFDGPIMLAYPAMWAAVGVLFFIFDRVLGTRHEDA